MLTPKMSKPACRIAADALESYAVNLPPEGKQIAMETAAMLRKTVKDANDHRGGRNLHGQNERTV